MDVFEGCTHGCPSGHPAAQPSEQSGKWKCVALPSSILNTCFVTVGLLMDAGLLALFFFSLVKRRALRNLLGKDPDNDGEVH